jgi:hypothetical protein
MCREVDVKARVERNVPYARVQASSDTGGYSRQLNLRNCLERIQVIKEDIMAWAFY